MSSLKMTSLTKAIFLMGPTASRKTELAILLRQRLPVELINVDSALIYRGMNIGTAKPSLNELALAPHRLLDIRDPAETYCVAEFCHDAIAEMADITKKGKIPLLVGGTMFYFKALLEGLSPLLPSANPTIRQYIEQIAREKSWKTLHSQLCKIDPDTGHRIHPNDLQRILRALEIFFITGKSVTELIQKSNKILPYNVYQFAIVPVSREILHQRITLRYNKMLELGFESEVQVLFERGDLHINMPSIRCVGYRQMWSYLSGNINYNDMIYQGINATKQLAKRQMTWLRSWPNLYWLDSDNLKLASDKVLKVININLK